MRVRAPLAGTRRAAARRLAGALAVSGAAHAVLLAQTSFSPLLSGPPNAARPFTVLLSQPAAEAPAPLPPVEVAHAPHARAAAGGSGPPQAAQAPAAPALPAEVFYRSAELDERAVPLSPVDVEYPAPALAARTRGSVKLRLLIDHRGELRSVEVLSSTPPGLFDEAALKAARALRFRPAVRNGVPVGSIKLIEVPFDPDCTVTGSCER